MRVGSGYPPAFVAYGGPLHGLWRLAGRYAACGGPLRGLGGPHAAAWRAATRPGFKAATRPTSSHSRYVRKAYHSNSGAHLKAGSNNE